MSDAHADRRERLREYCSASGADAALITRAANVRYLTGCPPQGAALLLTRDRAVLAVPEDAEPEEGAGRQPDPEVTRLPVPAEAD
ncbi:aminopeptidase P family N-terminal domain-containing protein, partial [Kitasatospora sp. NPDC057198]|uniref:aminopeptidase P family N-terminal domain-containing protein n=1 Tax=Kitasatospora sp. NPDC057198 TaxID=3346046 RepID=UPI003628F778